MKPAYLSKTVIVNLIALVLAILTLPQLNEVVPREWLPYIGGAIAVINIVLRFVTTEGISLTGK